MYFQMQHIKRASARDDLNVDDDRRYVAVGDVECGLGAYTALPELALRDLAGAAPLSVLGKRRPSDAPEPHSPTTPGVTQFARSWAAAARKRQHVATLRLHRATFFRFRRAGLRLTHAPLERREQCSIPLCPRCCRPLGCIQLRLDIRHS